MQTAEAQTDSNQQLKPKDVGGRPSKYNTRTLRRTKEYISSKVDEVPTVAGLACHLGVTRMSIYTWINNKIDQDFTDTVSKMTDERERQLVNKGLTGEYNPGTVSLILKTSHGYTENNQADSGVTINIDRSCGQDSVTVSKGDESVTIDQDTTT